MNQTGPFYVTGGTLHEGASCYAEREADHLLLRALEEGEFCYLLTPRQMGKSSLMVRTAAKLRAAGRRVAMIDLTAFGENLSAEQWYHGLLGTLGSQLGCERELEAWWSAHSHQSPIQRWFGALTQVALPRQGPGAGLVVFVDEIDFVRSLPFSTTEFFAAVRELYNRRAVEPALRRLTFCFLGVATPAELIENPRSTPFNIGRRIELADLRPEEAAVLEAGLAAGPGGNRRRAREMLRRVIHWTGGHPYLTQRLCQAVATAETGSFAQSARARVDAVCRELFLSGSGRRADDNLLFVADRLLRGHEDRAAMLELYGRVLRGAGVPWDSADPLHAALEVSGVVRRFGGRPAAWDAGRPRLAVRNRVYARLFDRRWVRESMPGAELRRQAAAFRRGLARAALAGGVAVAIFGGLGTAAASSERRASALNRELTSALAERDRTLNELEQALEQVTRHRDTAVRQTAAAVRAREAEGRQRVRADRASAAARAQSRIAGARAREASAHEQEARRRGAESRRRLAAHYVREGWRLADQGDLAASLPWFTAALQAEIGDPERERIHRIRIATVTAQSPTLLGVWRLPAPVFSLRAGGAGRRLGAATADGGAHLLDLQQPGTGPLVTSPSVAPARPRWDGKWALPSGEVPPRHPQALNLTCSDSSLLTAAGGKVREASLGGTTRRWTTQGTLGGGIVSEDGRFSLVWGIDGARLIDLRDGTDRSLAREACGYAAFSSNSRRVILVQEHRVRVFDTATGEVLSHWSGAPSQAILSPDGSLAAMCNWTGFELRDAGTGIRLNLRQEPAQGPAGVEFSPDGTRLYCFSGRGWLRVWDARTLRPLSPVVRIDGGFGTHCLTPDGTRVVTAGRTVEVWDPLTGRRTAGPLPLGDAAATALACLPGGDRVAVGCVDGTVRLWSLIPRRPAWVEEPGPVPMRSARLESFGHDIAGIPGVRLRPHGPVQPGRWGQAFALPDAVTAHRVSPSGRLVLAAGIVSGARLYRARGALASPVQLRLTGRERGVFDLPDGPVTAVAFSPDDARLATGSCDGAIRVWDTVTGGPVGPPMGQPGPIEHMEFSGDGKLLAVVAQSRVRVWDLGTGEPVTPRMTLPGPQARGPVAVFGPDGRSIWAPALGDRAYRLPLAPDRARMSTLMRRAELLSGAGLPDRTGGRRIRGDELLERWSELGVRSGGGAEPDAASRVAWHEQALEAAVLAREWNAAVRHLTELRELAPGRIELTHLLANALMELGRESEALVEQEAALAGTVSEAWARIGYYRLALLYLSAGDLLGYRDACRRLWDTAKEYRATNTVDLVTWTLALGPDAASYPDDVLAILRQAVRAEPNSLGLRNTLGALLDRFGRHREAVDVLEQVVRERGQEGSFADRVFLAMAHAGAGDGASARRWLELAEEAHREHLRQMETVEEPLDRYPDWADRAEHRILMEEARRVVGGKGEGFITP